MSMLLDSAQPTEVPQAHLLALKTALQSAIAGVATRGTDKTARGLHAAGTDLSLWLGRADELLSQYRPDA
jgi:hypothetical protein